MASFNIDNIAHSSARKQGRIAAMKNSPNANERKVADKKLRPSMKVGLPTIKKEEIKLVDKILGEERCGDGYYWCSEENCCKIISSVDESVTIEDVFGNTFVEFIDLISPESLRSEKQEKNYKISNEDVDKRRAPAELVARLSAKREGEMSQDGPNKPAYDAKQRILAKMKSKKNEEVELDEGIRLPSEFGHLLSVIVTWRGRSQYLRMFFPQAKLPSKKDIQAEINKVYPGGKVLQFSTSYLPSNHANFDSPIFKVTTKEEKELKKKCGKCKENTCVCSYSDGVDGDDADGDGGEIEEKTGLWANIHAKRKRGEAPAKKGSEDYPAKDAFQKAVKTSKEEIDFTESAEKRYCPKCEKVETRSECRFGPKYWDKFATN